MRVNAEPVINETKRYESDLREFCKLSRSGVMLLLKEGTSIFSDFRGLYKSGLS
jgi:hypothetical protein